MAKITCNYAHSLAILIVYSKNLSLHGHNSEMASLQWLFSISAGSGIMAHKTLFSMFRQSVAQPTFRQTSLCLILSLCGLTLNAQAAISVEQSPRATTTITTQINKSGSATHITTQTSASTPAPLVWSADEHASRLMRQDIDSNDGDEVALDVRTLPSRAGSIDSIVDRMSDSARQFGTTLVSKFQGSPYVNANSALVLDAQTGEVLYGKNVDMVRPMASITKVMTAVVTADAHLNMSEQITLQPEDFMGAKQASSTLRPGDTMNRAEVLLVALMKSENPAAAALARTYPGGKDVFIAAMNRKAKSLGMTNTFYGDPTGLDSRNVSTAKDLGILVRTAYQYGMIRQFASTAEHDFYLGDRVLHSKNTNALVRDGQWNIGLSKTGYIREAGRCVVMQANINQRPTVVVLLGADSSAARTSDATRLFSWLSGAFTRNGS